MTDERGAFAIKSLDTTLLFRVLVVADGCAAQFAEKVDPAAGPLRVTLAAAPPPPADPKCTIHGRVLDEEASPIAGAVVMPEMYMLLAGRGGGGTAPGMDAIAVTNERGEFSLSSDAPLRTLNLAVEAPGQARKNFVACTPASNPQALKLNAGVVVRGRLVRDGQPVPDAVIRLAQVNRDFEFVGPYEIGTDKRGRFDFLNVPAGFELCLAGQMDSLRTRGATPVRRIRPLKPGEVCDAGDLPVERAFKLSGRIFLSDGGPIPDQTPVLLSRNAVFDTQSVRVAADGRFEFEGLAPDVYELSTRVKGYRLAEKNASLNLLNPFLLEGRIDGDISGLELFLEPGEMLRLRQPVRDLKLESLRGAEQCP